MKTTTQDPQRFVDADVVADPSPMRPLVEPSHPHADTSAARSVGDSREADSVAPSIHHTFKILVTGPFAAGKTSLIQSVSQTEVVSTDVVTSGDESDVKSHTTVAMDFGTYQLPEEGISLLLFGTPGQPRFRFMTNILKGDVDVVAFVVDADARQTHAAAGVELRSMLSDLPRPCGDRRQPLQRPGRRRAGRTFARCTGRRAGRTVPAHQSCVGPERDRRDPVDPPRCARSRRFVDVDHGGGGVTCRAIR